MGIGTFLGGILVGAFIGGFIGFIVGITQSEGDSQIYVQGVRRGGKVITIQAEGEEVKSVINILEREKALGIKAL